MSKLRMLLAFWWIPYSASTWRRFTYAILAPPLAVVSLVLAVAGRTEVAARYQRRLARKLVGSPASEPPRRPRDPTVIAISVILLAIGLACWLLLWRFTYAILALPLTVNCLALALAGRAPARYRRRPARRPAGGSATQRTGVRLVACSIATLAVGLVSWVLLAYLPFFVLGNLAFPLLDYVSLDAAHAAPAYGGPPLPWDLWLGLHRVSYHGNVWASTYHDSNGGPTLAGAWAYHAGQLLVTFFPLFAWVIRGLTRLPARLTQALLGDPGAVPRGEPVRGGVRGGPARTVPGAVPGRDPKPRTS
jgi:hypothetical protein